MSAHPRNFTLAIAAAAALVAGIWWIASLRQTETPVSSESPRATDRPELRKRTIESKRTAEEIQVTAAARPCDRTVLTYLDLSRPPSQAELIAAGNLGESLTPTRPADPTQIENAAQRTRQEQDNLEFGTAIQAWNQHRYEEAYKLFEQHAKNSPDSPWVAESQLHLGCFCQYNGRLTEAAEWFDGILTTVEPKTEMHHKAKLRRSILHLDQGGLDASLQGFTEMKRDDADPAHQTYASYWIREIALLKKHETALRDCGQKALARVAEKLSSPDAARILRESESAGPHGFTAAELHATALEHGLDSRPVRADTALDELPLPFVAHYKDRHYVTVEKVSSDDVRVYDSRVGETTMPRQSFLREWSGFALIFSEPDTTAAIHPAVDLDTIIGGCCGHPRSPSDLGDDDDGCDKNCGMPGWSVNKVNFNFRVGDTPMWWEPPAGPPVMMSLLFNSLDSLTNYQPFGAKWSFEYATYLLITPGQQVQVRDGDGRLETFTAPAGGGGAYPITYTTPAGDFRTLVETADHVFTLTGQDGTIHHYGIPAAMAGNSSVPLLLSIQERHGNAVTITHNAQGSITSVSHSMLPAVTPSGGGAPVERKWEFTYNNITTPETVTVSGTAMYDYDSNGVGDSPLVRKRLVLLDGGSAPVLDGDGNPICAMTKDNGQFAFPPVAPGTYQVTTAESFSWPVVFGAQTTTNPAVTVSRVSRIDDPFGRNCTFQYDEWGNLTGQTDMGGLAYGYEYSSRLSQNAVSTNSSQSTFAIPTYELFISAIHTPKGVTRILTEPSNGESGIVLTPEETSQGYSSDYPPIGSNKMWTNYRIRVTNPENKTEEYYFDGDTTRGYHRNAIQLNRPAGQSVAPTTGARTRYYYLLVGGVKGKISSTSIFESNGSSIQAGGSVYSSTLLKKTARLEPNGYWTDMAYNNNGTISTVALPKDNGTSTSSHKIHYSYQPNGTDIDKIQRYLDGTLRTLLDFDYHSGTRDIQQTKDALDRITTYAWHSNGLPQSITDQTTGDILTFEYDQGSNDADGDPTWRLLRLKRNNVLIQQTEYDPIGRPAIQSDSAGDYVQTVYDGLNRLQRADFSDDTFIEHIWECCFIGETRSGKVSSGQDRVLERTKYFHDRRGLLTRSIDTAGKITRFGHDDAGRMATLTDPLGRVTGWTFDGYGRPDKKIYPDTSYEQTIWKYATYGVINKLRNRAGQEFTLASDSNGNSTSFYGPGINIIRIYDGWDRLDQIADYNYSSNAHNYDYDLLGRVTQLDGPWSNDTIGWQYLDSQRKVIRTAPGGANESTIGDNLGRVASIANPLGTFTPGYDGDTERLLSITHSGGFDTAYTYHGPELDRALNTITSKLPGGSFIAKHTYGYDSQNRINSWKREATLANPSGVTRSFEWTTRNDFASQLTSVAVKSLAGVLQGGWDYVYDSAGNIASTQTGTGPANPAALTNRAHNTLNQITTLGGGGMTTIRGTLNEPGKVSVGITGQGDKPARMIQDNRFEAELPLAEGANSISVTAMDGNYNRADYVFSVNVAARSAQSFAYDTNGNLLSDGVRGYEWDSLSRLKKITWTAGKTTEFKYNALGQRSERTETDGSTITKIYHLFDGIDPIDRRTGTTADTATINRRYFTQGEQHGGGSSWDNYHYCRDHLGSIREVVKVDGTLAARYDYDPYGKRLTQYQASTYTGGCDLGFTGHITVPSLVTGQTEMVLTHFRFYEPELGRWLSADPIGEEGGLNLYGYVGNNPVNEIDRLGLWQITISAGYIGGGQLTFGNHGGAGIFDGQWNMGLKGGVGMGVSAGLDFSDTGCRKEGPSFGANTSGTLGIPAFGVGASYDYDSNADEGTLSYGGRIGPVGSNTNWTLNDHGRLVNPRQSFGLSNYGASVFSGMGINYAGKVPSNDSCVP